MRPEPEPHAARRRAIIKAHPGITDLGGVDWRSKYICAALVAAQLKLMLVAPLLSPLAYAALVYIVGATISQALFLAVHELAHSTFFQMPALNRAFALVANLPAVFPYAISFREYHMEHHTSQGTEGVDTDLPSNFERAVFTGAAGKLVWLVLQIVAYALRPLLTRPKPFTEWHAANLLSQFAFVAYVAHNYGAGPIIYLLTCLMVSGGAHPCAGHFLSEHYGLYDAEADSDQETFSYYGPLNWLTWNVGYHNEHHDFPRVPWSRLPLVRSAAPEFYEPLIQCPSWPGALVRFVADPKVGLQSRRRRVRPRS